MLVECVVAYYDPQIRSKNHWPLFRVRSLNNGVRCMSSCVLISIEKNVFRSCGNSIIKVHISVVITRIVALHCTQCIPFFDACSLISMKIM